MKNNPQLPPVLLAHAIALFLNRRVHFSKSLIGETVKEDEEFVIFRKVVVDPIEKQPLIPKALFKVYFRFARFTPNINKILSLIPIPFIIAQPGFRSKTWMSGKDTGTFQGLYEWDSVEDAERYWDSFPLKLMKRRSIPETLRYEIIEINNEANK